MKKLSSGVRNFQKNVFPQKKELFESLAEQQSPSVLFITCSDSRIAPSLITQTEPGDMFVLRNAGNIVLPYSESALGEAATIEYAVKVLNVGHVVVCGHSNCGAVKALLKPGSADELPAVKEWLKYADKGASESAESSANFKETFEKAVQQNVLTQLNHLKTHPCIASALEKEGLQLHGWFYRIDTGDVLAHTPAQDSFVDLDQALNTA